MKAMILPTASYLDNYILANGDPDGDLAIVILYPDDWTDEQAKKRAMDALVQTYLELADTDTAKFGLFAQNFQSAGFTVPDCIEGPCWDETPTDPRLAKVEIMTLSIDRPSE